MVSNAAVGTEERWHPTGRPWEPWEIENTTGRVNHTLLSLYRYDNIGLQFYYLVGNVRSHKFSAKNVSSFFILRVVSAVEDRQAEFQKETK